jgi:hypothetical protein
MLTVMVNPNIFEFEASVPKSPICPQCHRPLRFLLQKGSQGRKYQCIDCEGIDPLYSPDVGRLLQAFQPPK